MFDSLWQVLPRDEAGEGPAVVLLHAGIADRTMWSEHLEPLAEAGFRALALDLSGFGEASPLSDEQAPWLDVLATMDALGLHEAVLVGNSFGGAVALRVALVAPDRVSGLALISAPAPGISPGPELRAALEAEREALGRGDLDEAVAAVVEAWTLPDAPTELLERIATMQRRAYEHQAEGSTGAWLSAEGSEAEEPGEAGSGGSEAEAGDATGPADPLGEDPQLLGSVRVRTLVTVGEHDRPEFLRAAGVLTQHLPDARLQVIAGAGHLAPLEAPEAFREILLAFLREGQD